MFMPIDRVQLSGTSMRMTNAHNSVPSSPSHPAIFVPSGNVNLAEFLSVNQDLIAEGLEAKGAVLFRGFAVADAIAFDAAIGGYGGENFSYEQSLSNAVRVNVTARVFTANEAPPTTEIFLHHEMAQTPVYPSKLFFYCEAAAEQGGATPLCRSDLLLERMQAELPGPVAEFADKGVRYSNTMPADDDAVSGQGRSWKSTLSVNDRSGAEARLSQLGYSWQWQNDGALRVTTPRLEAMRQTADGRSTFFNQLIAAYRGWSDGRNAASRSITFGDGGVIDHDAMLHVISIADDLTYDHNWQTGDVVLVDNYLVMHGRRPFRGQRRVLASLLR
ncbi:TauD/TfdA family dioxygenase [Pontixanthobacter sp.]|uniref:TauD/TfdA family dioxygenase n=1 Tax=Pontixanthobacter sp. TaxID=2792078 RepID=UPI003C79D453